MDEIVDGDGIKKKLISKSIPSDLRAFMFQKKK
jgi:hypothetical protein